MPLLPLLALAANLVLIVVCLLVGGRLVRLSSRTRKLPEFLLGASFVLSALAVAANLTVPFLGEASAGRSLLAGASRSLIALAVGLILLLSWRIFRPEAGWARGLVAVGAVMLCMSAMSTGQAPSPDGSGTQTFYWLGRIGLIMPYSWAAIEAYLYQRDLRRRQRLGLAPDDFMATRLALWSIGLALCAALYVWIALSIGLSWYLGIHLPMLFAASGFGLLIAASFWLAFFPPKSWSRDETASDRS